MSTTTLDPIRKTAELICTNEQDVEALELRLKNDIFNSIGRIKPQLTADVDFESEVLNGAFFATLTAPLQAIAVARCEGPLAFYNRIGWHVSFLDAQLTHCVAEEHEAHQKLTHSFHVKSLHDLSYIHPKTFEKLLGKTGAASLWESLKRFNNTQLS